MKCPPYHESPRFIAPCAGIKHAHGLFLLFPIARRQNGSFLIKPFLLYTRNMVQLSSHTHGRTDLSRRMGSGYTGTIGTRRDITRVCHAAALFAKGCTPVLCVTACLDFLTESDPTRSFTMSLGRARYLMSPRSVTSNSKTCPGGTHLEAKNTALVFDQIEIVPLGFRHGPCLCRYKLVCLES